MRTLIILSIAALFCGTANAVFAQNTTTVNFDSGSYMLYSSAVQNDGTRLTAGNPAAAGDGAVLRLGYYSQATSSDLFAGTFIPLSGQGSANSAYAMTSIGDDASGGAGPGTFAMSLNFVTNSPTMGQNLPPATPQILAIQFYNGTTMTNSTLYNVVSAPSWQFLAPASSPTSVALSLDDSGVTYLGGGNYTSLAVPEPQSTTVIAMSIAALFSANLVRRKSRAKISL